MSRTTVSVEGLGHGAQPIPLGVSIGSIFVTGNISGVDRTTGVTPAEVEAEFETAFANIEATLQAAGLTMGNVAKFDVLLSDLANRDALNGVWTRWFADADDRPARHTAAANLPKNLRIQVSLLAVRD